MNKYTVCVCPGAAHSNAFIDYCGLCMPFWGVIVLPAEFSSLEEWMSICAVYRAEGNTRGLANLKRSRTLAIKAYKADAKHTLDMVASKKP